jgi:hypothetical protein
MSSNSKFNIDLIRIDEITITNAAIDNRSELSSLSHIEHKFTLESLFNASINESKKKIKILFTCKINILSNSNDQELGISGHFDIAYIFFIENFDDLTTINNDNADINPDLYSGLIDIAYSTSRGIIYTRCLGTILKNIILPVQSTTNLVEH